MRRLAMGFVLLTLPGCGESLETLDDGAVAGYPFGAGYTYVVVRSQPAWSMMYYWNNAAAAPGSLPAVDFGNGVYFGYDVVAVAISEPKPGPGYSMHLARLAGSQDAILQVTQDGPSGAGAATRPYVCSRLSDADDAVWFRRTGVPDALGEEKTYAQLVNMDYALRSQFPPVTDEAAISMLNAGAAPGTGETLVSAQLPGWMDNEETAWLAPVLGSYWISERYYDYGQGAFVNLWYGPFRPGAY